MSHATHDGFTFYPDTFEDLFGLVRLDFTGLQKGRTELRQQITLDMHSQYRFGDSALRRRSSRALKKYLAKRPLKYQRIASAAD